MEVGIRIESDHYEGALPSVGFQSPMTAMDRYKTFSSAATHRSPSTTRAATWFGAASRPVYTPAETSPQNPAACLWQHIINDDFKN
jgi:hypothetical protein